SGRTYVVARPRSRSRDFRRTQGEPQGADRDRDIPPVFDRADSGPDRRNCRGPRNGIGFAPGAAAGRGALRAAFRVTGGGLSVGAPEEKVGQKYPILQKTHNYALFRQRITSVG